MSARFLRLLILSLILSFSLQAQWLTRTNGLPLTFWATFIDAVSPTLAVGNLNDKKGVLYRTVDAGLNWENIGCPETEYVLTLSAIDSLHIWIATNTARIFYTSDGGKTWVKQFVDSSKTRYLNYIKMFDAQHGLAMGDALAETLPPVFLRTTDGGEHWISVNDSSIGGYSSNQWSMLSFLSPDTGYFFSMGGAQLSALYKTLDGGKTWKRTAYPYLGAMTIKFYSERLGMVGFYGSVYRTTDGGDTWEKFSYTGNIAVMEIEFMKNDPSKVWLLTQKELMVSVDTGRTWTLILNLPQLCYDLNFPDSTHGWIVGKNTLLYSENPYVVSALENRHGFLPSGFALEQNYPNPFNPSTTIRYSLPENSRVKLEVFNLLGERVAELVNADESAGYKQVVWNAQVPTGIYFCRIEAYSSASLTKRYSESRKMLILK